MGAIVKMKIRCYSLNEILNMRGLKSIDDFEQFLVEYNIKIFQPPKSPGSGRARRQTAYYLTTNEEFDYWVRVNNTVAILKNIPIAKVKYKEYPEDTLFYI